MLNLFCCSKKFITFYNHYFEQSDINFGLCSAGKGADSHHVHGFHKSFLPAFLFCSFSRVVSGGGGREREREHGVLFTERAEFYWFFVQQTNLFFTWYVCMYEAIHRAASELFNLLPSDFFLLSFSCLITEKLKLADPSK